MKQLKDLTVDNLKNAIWCLNNNMCPGHGIYQDKEELRQELFRRTGETLGYHEEH